MLFEELEKTAASEKFRLQCSATSVTVSSGPHGIRPTETTVNDGHVGIRVKTETAHHSDAEALLLAHEMGHALTWSMPPVEYRPYLHPTTRPPMDRLQPKETRRAIIVVEIRAWVLAWALLQEHGFKDWAVFEKAARQKLGTYVEALGAPDFLDCRTAL